MRAELKKTGFFQRIVLPAFLAIILYVLSLFVLIIPAFRENIMEEKRTMLKELTNTAWSILYKYNQDFRDGKITDSIAKSQAKARIESLRYGSENKDYFWITDMQPVMVTHPYVHELNGKSLQDFSDPNGKKLFMEAQKIAQEQNEGFIEYCWQLRDNPGVISQKLSFVKRFKDWDWIIGTGIYIHDLETEISALTRKVIILSAVIVFIISLIIIFITHQSLKIERKRNKAEQKLSESREKYRSLLESSTEGILLLMDNKISYSNIFIRNWLGYTEGELISSDIKKIIPETENFTYSDTEVQKEISIIKKDLTQSNCIVSAIPVTFADKKGILLTFKDISESNNETEKAKDFFQRIEKISEEINFGYFRFDISDKAEFSYVSNTLIKMLGYTRIEEISQTELSRFFSDKAVYKSLIKTTIKGYDFKKANINLKHKSGADINATIQIFTNKNKSGKIRYIDGLIRLSENTNYSLKNDDCLNLFTHSGSADILAKDIMLPVIKCAHNTKVSSAFEIIARHNTDEIIVEAEGKPIGVFSYSTYFKHVPNGNFSTDDQVYSFMVSPLKIINENTPAFEAWNNFFDNQNKNILVGNSEKILGKINAENLLQISGSFMNLMIQNIEKSITIEQLGSLRKKYYQYIVALLKNTSDATTASIAMSTLNDAITKKIVEISISENGQAPVEFSFFTFGSAGRKELSFSSDQDNAFIYAESDKYTQSELQKYFNGLSEKICKYLHLSGLQECSGGYMASNPKWCQPLNVWKNYFFDWICNSDPKSILNVSVFFDLRNLYGSQQLFESMRNYIAEELSGKTAFFFNLAQTVHAFKPPVNLFGNIVSEPNSDKLDIKNCISTVTAFVRVYALSSGIEYIETLNRIKALKEKGIFSEATSSETEYHFRFLHSLRAKHQAEQYLHHLECDNYISIKKLTEIDQTIIKKIFSQMNSYQQKLSASFMSSYKG